MISPIAIVTPITGIAAAKRAQIIEAARDGKPRRAYLLAYSLFFDETGIRLPNPPHDKHAGFKLYREIGRAFIRLPELERWRIKLAWYDFLRSIVPEFESDLDSVPKIFKWIFPWPQLLEFGMSSLWHDFLFRIGVPRHLARAAQKAADEMYRKFIIEMGMFSPALAKPCYWLVACWRYPALRLRGHARFTVVEATA